jgi:hypothetical protein
VFDGIARPLEARLEQVVASQREVVPAFKLSELIIFYAGVISPLLGPLPNAATPDNAAKAATAEIEQDDIVPGAAAADEGKG